MVKERMARAGRFDTSLLDRTCRFDRKKNPLVMDRFRVSTMANKIKSIVKPERVQYCSSAHHCQLNKGSVARLFDGTLVSSESREVDRQLLSFDQLFIAHYRSKSIVGMYRQVWFFCFFENVVVFCLLAECLFKCARGYKWLADKNIDYCANDYGERDDSAAEYARGVREVLPSDSKERHE
jgi:hypothetical protein